MIPLAERVKEVADSITLAVSAKANAANVLLSMEDFIQGRSPRFVTRKHFIPICPVKNINLPDRFSPAANRKSPWWMMPTA